MAKVSNLWEFESEQDRKDFDQSVIAAHFFIQKYIKYLENKANQLEKQVDDRGVLQEYNFKESLATLIGEKRALRNEIKNLKKLLTNE